MASWGVKVDLSSFHGWLRAAHIGAGFLGLAAFWLPLLARKGGRVHVVCGRVFVACAAIVLGTALAVCGWALLDPFGPLSPGDRPPAEQAAAFARRVRLIAAFLGALAVYTAVPLVLAVRVVRTRRDPGRLAGPGTRLLLWSEVGVSLAVVGYAAAYWAQDPGATLAALVLGAGVGGLGAAWWDLRFLGAPRPAPMAWWYKHMEFMLRTGIAFHTAFAVFGLKPWLGVLGSGPWALVPWVLPSVVGVPAVWLWVGHYRRRFGELSPADPAPVGAADAT
jgi:hypothetical protein